MNAKFAPSPNCKPQRQMRVRPGRFRLSSRALSVMIFAMSLALADVAMGQDDGPDEMSREQWKSRVDAARQRAGRMKREGKVLDLSKPSDRQKADENSRRVLEDDSLRIGDIVSTSKGLFRFDGRAKDESNSAYFSPLGKHLKSKPARSSPR